ncbi:MAG: hypothetical protein JWN53_574 [Gemmatimonadetes bacterium]|nr:hypothetical protein [Gemmatimonadota bacterium]
MARHQPTLFSVRAATSLGTTRPAWAAGFRAAFATVAPLVVAAMLGSEGGTWLSLGGFNGALSDRGGSYRTKAVTIGAVSLGTAVAVVIGTLGGSWLWIAVPLTFAVAFVASLARVWGNPGVSIGSASLSTFVIALAFPSTSVTTALTRGGLALLGGLWAMTIALVLWPILPFRPARLAVAQCYRALADFVLQMEEALARSTVDESVHLPVGSAAVRGALENARLVLTQLRRGRPGSGGRGEHLLLLGDLVDQMFGHLVAIADMVETVPPAERDPGVQLLLQETLAMIRSTLRALADSVEAERDATPVPLGWNGEALRALVAAHQPHGQAMRNSVANYLQIATIVDRCVRFAEAAVATVRSLHEGNERAPMPASRDEDEESTSPFAILGAIVTPDSMLLRYALRVAVVTAIAVLLAGLLDLKRGYWITITVIVIMQPYTGATTNRALQRVIGTVLGGLLTAALGAYFHDPRALLVLSFVFAAACVALMPVNYAAYSIFLTPTFVLLAEAQVGDWHLARTRVVNTLLGGVLALAGSRLLWPSPESTRLPGYLSDVLRASADYLRTVVRLFADRSDEAGERIRAARRRIGLSTVNAEESFQRLLGEYDGPTDGLAPWMTFLTYIRRLTASIAALALARHTSSPGMIGALQPFTDAVADVLDDMSTAIAEGRPPTPLPMFAALDEAERTVPPLLRPRVDRLAAQLRMVHEAVRRSSIGGAER